MAESGHVMPAPAGAFPRIISQEMSRDNFQVYHMAPLETDTLSPRCRASVHAGMTFQGQHRVFSCSLESTVSNAAVSSTICTAPNTSVSAVMPDGAGQKQLPSVQAVRASGEQHVDASLMSHSPAQHLATCTTLTSSVAETATLSTTCTKPVSSSHLCHQRADQKIMPCFEVNFDGGQHCSVKDSKVLNQQLSRADGAVSGDAVKVEPKVEVESIDVNQRPLSSDVSVDIETEQLKHSIKSEVSREVSVDQHILKDVKLPNATVAEKPACDTELNNESRRKGT